MFSDIIFSLMHIEVLYFESCPNYETAVDNLRHALQQKNMVGTTTVSLTLIKSASDAIKNKFIGSPSFRIAGRDLFGLPPDATYGLRCRIYLLKGQARGVPSVDDFARALTSWQ